MNSLSVDEGPDATQQRAGDARPDWRLLVGHDDTLARWRDLITRQALPSPLLLTGRDGIGKRGLLTALAAYHLCESNSACGNCYGCRQVLAGTHPEVLWLEVAPGAAFLIDEAKELQEHLALSPGAGAKFRIVCLVDADRISEAAANRLLKILEEPPPQARIFLSTSRAGAILPTILSRLVKWQLPPPALAASLGWLKAMCLEAGLSELTDASLVEALRHAALSPGLAWRHLLADAGNKSDEFCMIPLHADAAEMVDWAEAMTRQQGRTAAELVEAWDLALNKSYRDMLQAGVRPSSGLMARTRSRELLRRARQLARGARVPLNAQLLAEALAFIQRP